MVMGAHCSAGGQVSTHNAQAPCPRLKSKPVRKQSQNPLRVHMPRTCFKS